MPADLPDNFESYVGLTLLKAIRDALSSIPTTPAPGEFAPVTLAQRVFEGGQIQAPPKGAEEWFQIWPMTVIPLDSHATIYLARTMTQISCCALLAEAREDGSTQRPWQLAHIVSKAIRKKSFQIRDYNEGGSSSVVLGVLSIREVSMRYLNRELSTSRQSTIGAMAANIPAPPVFHQVALTVRGVTDQFQ